MQITIKNGITGPEIIALIASVARDYSEKTRINVVSQDFCRAADISRQQLYLYRKGHQPANEGIKKIARGIRSWGYEVTIN